MKRSLQYVIIAGLLCSLVLYGTALAGTRYVGLGTGEITGVYFQAGGAIARIINPMKDTYGIRIIVEPTDGSVYNINAVLAHDLTLALAQSDIQQQAVAGFGDWQGRGRQTALRSVFALYPESVTLIVRKNAGIKTVADLKGKRVNLGSRGSGTFRNAVDVLTTAGLDPESDVQAGYEQNGKAADLLVAGRIDGLFITVGHPSRFVRQLLSHSDSVTLVPVTGMESLLSAKPYYTPSRIPTDFYPSLKGREAVPSVGVKATLVTSADVPEEIVYVLVKEIFENFEQFKSLHPIFSTLTMPEMLEGCVAPFHDGAMKYYRKILMKK